MIDALFALFVDSFACKSFGLFLPQNSCRKENYLTIFSDCSIADYIDMFILSSREYTGEK